MTAGKRFHWIWLPVVALGVFALSACREPERDIHLSAAPPVAEPENVTVEPRIGLLPTFPCTRCHDHLTPNPEKRLLVKFHTVRNKEFHHGDPKGWCYNCHTLGHINYLHTSKGDLVTFDQAYLLCGGCHGDKLRDWKMAVHGKTMGNWNGPKIRRSCTGCHNPHRPAFPSLEPEPPPPPPEQAPGL
jgi:hypothetical protein